MHDPSYVVADVPLPIPRLSTMPRRNAKRTGITRMRRTNPADLGKPVYPWWRLHGWEVRFLNNDVRLRDLGTIWHNEPKGRDAFSICKDRPPRERPIPFLRWCWKHREHLRYQQRFGMHTWRYFTLRCSDCKQRFGWREAHFGTGWDSPETVHERCLNVRGLRHERHDLLSVILDTADETQRWRVSYNITKLRERLDTAAIKEMLR